MAALLQFRFGKVPTYKTDPVFSLITKHGKPAALVIGVEGEALEDLLTMGNPRFWEMIEDRRRTKGSTTLAEVRARYGISKPSRRRKKRAPRDLSAKHDKYLYDKK